MLFKEKEKYKDELLIVMWFYFEKLCIIVGWKGFINDFDIDNSFKINKGFCLSRQFFVDFIIKGMFFVSEMFDIISLQFLVDFLSVGVVGVCIIESQFYCELVSGFSFFVGFKNGIDGSLGVVVDVIGVVKYFYYFFFVIKFGVVVIVGIVGNEDCFVIFCGGIKGINYDVKSIVEVKVVFEKVGFCQWLMVDCSYGNFFKNYKNQFLVVVMLVEQIEKGEEGVMGVMIESNIGEGELLYEQLMLIL